ncbi:hypothetical protein WJX74_000048 [Apatococcus lobatus]|uniref:Large ribosomal subunit protein mL45 n=1 Tax=Apatococcus lobatus TaxID=904363 RepID=A0AAW1RNM4_9CHLO
MGYAKMASHARQELDWHDAVLWQPLSPSACLSSSGPYSFRTSPQPPWDSLPVSCKYGIAHSSWSRAAVPLQEQVAGFSAAASSLHSKGNRSMQRISEIALPVNAAGLLGNRQQMQWASARGLQPPSARYYSQTRATTADAGHSMSMQQQTCQQWWTACQVSRSAYSGRRFGTRAADGRGMIAIKPNHVLSPNILIDPYRGEPPRLPLSSWFTLSGWKERIRRWQGSALNVFVISRCRKYIPGWSLKGFKQEALDLYEQSCLDLARGDYNALRNISTPKLSSELKSQLRQRVSGGWKRVHWEMADRPTLRQLQLLRARIGVMNQHDPQTWHVQLTVRFESKQRFAAFDGKGDTMAGSMTTDIPVTDYWIFERSLRSAASSQWRVAARLPPPIPS